MGFIASPFRSSRSYAQFKGDESTHASLIMKSPEPSSSSAVSEEEKTPTQTSSSSSKIAFPEDSMRTPSPEEPSSSSNNNNNNNNNANGRKALGEMTNDVSMTPLSAKLKNLKFSSPTDHHMSPATKFVNRKAHHTKKDKSAGSFGQGRIALGLGRGKFMTTKRAAPSRFATSNEGGSLTENQ
ncbi:unnamed protein product [Bathycoccus prasinos]